jgi:hypothetical protein
MELRATLHHHKKKYKGRLNQNKNCGNLVSTKGISICRRRARNGASFLLESFPFMAYQPPASSTFLSEQTIQQQPANSTFLSAQISTSHQPNEQAVRLLTLCICRSPQHRSTSH